MDSFIWRIISYILFALQFSEFIYFCSQSFISHSFYVICFREHVLWCQYSIDIAILSQNNQQSCYRKSVDAGHYHIESAFIRLITNYVTLPACRVSLVIKWMMEEIAIEKPLQIVPRGISDMRYWVLFEEFRKFDMSILVAVNARQLSVLLL